MKEGWKSIGVHAAFLLELKKATYWSFQRKRGFWNNSDNSFVFLIFKYLLP